MAGDAGRLHGAAAWPQGAHPREQRGAARARLRPEQAFLRRVRHPLLHRPDGPRGAGRHLIA
eukprot:3379830-Prymnesium_polylepis.1